MAHHLEILQLNCHRSREVLTSLGTSLPSGSFLCLLQEPYLHNLNVCGLDRSRLLFTRDVSARTAIYFSANIRPTFHGNLSDRDCTTCSLELNGKRVFYSSVYLDINKSVEQPKWLATIAKARASGSSHMAGIDANAHSPLWGSPASNPRGLSLEDVIFTQSLSLLNVGNNPLSKPDMDRP